MVRARTLILGSVIGLSEGLTYIQPTVTVKGGCVDPKTGKQPQVCKHAIAALSALSNAADAPQVFQFKKECEAYMDDWDCELDVSMTVFLAGMRDRCILQVGWEIPIELRDLGFVTENYIYTNVDFTKASFLKDHEGSLLLNRAIHAPWKPYENLTKSERAEFQDHCTETNYEPDDKFVMYKHLPEKVVEFNDYLANSPLKLARYEVVDPKTYEPMPYRKKAGLWGNFVLPDVFGGYNELNGVPYGTDRTYIAIDLSLYDPSRDETATTEPAETTEPTTPAPTTTEEPGDDKGKGVSAKIAGVTAVAVMSAAVLAL